MDIRGLRHGIWPTSQMYSKILQLKPGFLEIFQLKFEIPTWQATPVAVATTSRFQGLILFLTRQDSILFVESHVAISTISEFVRYCITVMVIRCDYFPKAKDTRLRNTVSSEDLARRLIFGRRRTSRLERG